MEKIRGDKDVEYAFYNTGVEYQATKDHLKQLESKYGIEIKRVQPIKAIPTCCREFGVPFLSKFASEMIGRLQAHDFKFEDLPYEVLVKQYPKCISAVKWWCNCQSEKVRQYNISYNKYLKEFLIQNPPPFRISNKCCTYAKKKPAKKCLQESGADLNVIGVRRSEGGIRATVYKNCYTQSENGADQYRPLFFMNDDDKSYYEQYFDITHSDCYTKYGLKRTGCVGCPFGRDILDELSTIEKFEPKLYKACLNIFGVSYEYKRKYKQFVAAQKQKEKGEPEQMSLFDNSENVADCNEN